MQNILLMTIGYMVEVSFLAIVYFKVVKKELVKQKIDNKSLIRRTIVAFFIIINIELQAEKEDKKEENEVAVSLYKEILGEQLIKCLLYGIILILTPIVSPAMVSVNCICAKCGIFIAYFWRNLCM